MVGGGRLTHVMRLCERLVLNRTDLVVVLSAEMKHQLRRIGVSTPIEVVPLWVDTDHLRPAPPVGGPPIRVLYSGNLGRKQGLDQVIELARELAVRRSTGVTVLAVQRGNDVTTNPAADFQLSSGDVLVVVGEPMAIDAALALVDPQAPVA